jgi:quinol monooxygenase YgiN
VPYFLIEAGQLEPFKELCSRFVAKTSEEEGCLYYGFSFSGNVSHCREGYTGADAVLAHLKNVQSLLEEALRISSLVRLEIHGPESELTKLRAPLAALNPEFFVLECGFRRG